MLPIEIGKDTLILFQSYSSLVKSSGAGDRVFYLLDRHPPPPGKGNLVVKSFEGDGDEAPTSEDISIENVSFSYPTRPDALVLSRISLRIESGSVVALVGHSGCGKSTIISLLERLYDPKEGSIKFGNKDLRSTSLEKHRDKIGLVTQDPVLVSLSQSSLFSFVLLRKLTFRRTVLWHHRREYQIWVIDVFGGSHDGIKSCQRAHFHRKSPEQIQRASWRAWPGPEWGAETTSLHCSRSC